MPDIPQHSQVLALSPDCTFRAKMSHARTVAFMLVRKLDKYPAEAVELVESLAPATAAAVCAQLNDEQLKALVDLVEGQDGDAGQRLLAALIAAAADEAVAEPAVAEPGPTPGTADNGRKRKRSSSDEGEGSGQPRRKTAAQNLLQVGAVHLVCGSVAWVLGFPLRAASAADRRTEVLATTVPHPLPGHPRSPPWRLSPTSTRPRSRPVCNLPCQQKQGKCTVIDLLQQHNGVETSAGGGPDRMRFNRTQLFELAGGLQVAAQQLKDRYFKLQTEVTVDDCAASLNKCDRAGTDRRRCSGAGWPGV